MSELAVLPTETPVTSARSNWADSAGMLASIACAIHCAAMPMVIGYLPLLGLQWLANESFHQVMAFVCFGLAAVAFVPGWRKHGSFVPACVGLAGVTLLSVAAFGLEDACCPTCATACEAQAQEAACTDEACQLCAQSEQQIIEMTAPTSDVIEFTKESTTEQTEAVEESTDSAFAWLAPFVTPLGGCLLVVGHLVNHRKSCGCRDGHCCLEGDQTAAT